MLLLFIVIVFIMLHLQFFARFILFGTYETHYFYFTHEYLFDVPVAVRSSLFVIACMIAFIFGYLVIYRKFRSYVSIHESRPDVKSAIPLGYIVFFGLIQIIAGLILAINSNFEYQLIAESFSFVFELRIFFLLMLSYLLLNISFTELFNEHRYKLVRVTVYCYIIVLLMLQSRSLFVELFSVIVCAYIMWHGDRSRLVYFPLLIAGFIFPNIIVLGRLDWSSGTVELVEGIFSFEYSVLFNNILSATIERGETIAGSFTFFESLALLIPSPIRRELGLVVIKSDYYSTLSEIAAVNNGGFSLLAEMFTNFGWYAPIIFILFGSIIGIFNSAISRVGRVNLISAAGPLIYAAFIMAFRNDFGVFIKYVIQLLLIAGFLSLFFKLPRKILPSYA